MRRNVVALLLALVLMVLPQVASAGHGHHHHGGGWGGGWGHHHHGWGGYGGFYGSNYGWGGYYGSGISLSIGYPRYASYGYGCFSPRVYSCYQPNFNYYSSPIYGCGTTYFGSYPGGYYSNYYGPGYGGVSTSGTYYVPSTGYLSYSAPTTYQPAELAYGPQAVRQFLGMPRVQPEPASSLSTEAKVLAALYKSKEASKSVASVADKVRTSNVDSRRRADQFLSQGDVYFKEQKYQQAAQRYKLAAEAAPDVAEAYWRLGHAYMASNRTDLAAGAFTRAMRTSGDLGRGGFSLKKLYGESHIARESHLESLAAEAMERMDDTQPLLVMAVSLHYAGETERAAKFFERVRQMAPEQVSLLAGFKTETGKAVLVSHEADLEI